MKINWLILLGFVAGAIGFVRWLNVGNKVDFNTQIKPLLNKNCLACHGGVKRAGGVSLLFREEALGKGKSGKFRIVLGQLEASEFIKRLSTSDLNYRMPYRKAALNPDEIDLLTRWVKEGAEWGEHWAYQTLVLPSVPRTSFGDEMQGLFSERWQKNDIDYFVSQHIATEGLQNVATLCFASLHSPEAKSVHANLRCRQPRVVLVAAHPNQHAFASVGSDKQSCFVEASFALAKRVNGLPEKAIAQSYLLAMGRGIAPKKMALLVQFYQKSWQRFQSKPTQVKAFLNTNSTPHLAILTVDAILNLDEVITKE